MPRRGAPASIFRCARDRALGVCAAESDESIPACAGEPRDRAAPSAGGWVYPRVCGGTRLKAPDAFNELGLSPRVRGNQAQGTGRVQRAGSIPACAGEPGSRHRTRSTSWVYPRVCGGTTRISSFASRVMGLSPRVRGNQRKAPPRHHRRGSIPACAGEPWSAFPTRCHRRVYPRVCGGTMSSGSRAVRATGLSPRVRGNRGRAPPR